MKKILIFFCFISINLLGSNEPNTALIKNLQQHLKTGKDTLEKVEELLTKISIVDGKLIIKGISSNEDIDILLKFFNDNAALYQTLQNLISPNKTCSQRLLNRITSISPDTLHAVKWATIGSLSTILGTLAINSIASPNICSSFPTGNLLKLTLSSGSLCAFLILKYVKIPTSWYFKLGWKALNLTAELLPYIGKGFANLITNGQIRHNTPKSIKAFQDLQATHEQRNLLSSPNVFLTAAITPAIFVNEHKFLNSLNEEQINKVYIMFNDVNEKENFANFEVFANTLSDSQAKKLNPENKLVLAKYCPKMLLSENNDFLSSLSAEQTAMLGKCIIKQQQ